MTENNDLQLERAEFDDPAQGSACGMCAQPLQNTYFQVNGHSVCPACRERALASLTGGSPLKRGLLAIVAGVGVAIGGSILYYAILALSGYEFGLIAIVVGFAVGKAVSWGAEGRGGWPYQSLAMLLTYLAIVSAYVPVIINGAVKGDQTTQSQPSTSDVTPSGTEAAVTPLAVRAEPSAAAAAGVTPRQVALGLAMLAAILFVSPFLSGFSNIIGLVIIAIGLYEAWKLNRRMVLVMTGPHTLGLPSTAVPAP